MANNNYAKQLNSAWHKGFEEGLWSGEMFMLMIPFFVWYVEDCVKFFK